MILPLESYRETAKYFRINHQTVNYLNKNLTKMVIYIENKFQYNQMDNNIYFFEKDESILCKKSV